MAQNKEYKAMFGLLFFITQFSSLITQNILSVWHNHSLVITQYFSYYLWVPYLSHCAGFFFFFFFHLVSLNPVKKKKKIEPNCQPGEEREKKRVKSGQKVRLVLFVGPLCMFNYNIAIELWVMETEIAKSCFQFL